jgi:acyl-CoA synthetase (NDP forming)
LVGFGIGGIAVEVWRDVVYRASPLTDQDARDMLRELRGRALLEGFRGAPPADREALIDVILRVGQLAQDLPGVLEMDINPLIAGSEGKGVVAVDARVRVG